MKNSLLLLLVCFWITSTQANNYVFTLIDASKGLSDNQIRYILQLPDDRMVFTTSGNVNIFNGMRFIYLHRSSEHIYPLSKYDGSYRIYQSGDSILWIKDNHKLMFIDLHKETYQTNLDHYFQNRGIDQPVDDLFIDAQGRLWLLLSDGLQLANTSERLDLSSHQGNLQDLAAEGNLLYLFYSTGEVSCYDMITKKRLYSVSAYPAEERVLYQNTSLVIRGNDGFYQLRNGQKGGFFFFDLRKRTWKKLLEQNYRLNTLILDKEGIAFISCMHGIWMINPKNEERQYIPVLKTRDGKTIATEISTLFYDRQGGLWIGTVNRGLLYYHPSRYKFNYVGSASSLPPEVLNKLNNADKPTFQGKTYTAVCTDVRGWTWAGTPDGLELFVPEIETKRVFYVEDGLSNNFVHAILEDRYHNIWVTTSHGISKIQVDSITKKIHFANFNTFDGTLNGEYSDGAAYEAADGTLYFGGVEGFNIIHPEHSFSPELPLKPIFTVLHLYGEEVKTGKTYGDRIILSKAPSYTEELELAYNQNFLTFEFSAPNYRNQTQTRYRYQLEGIDKRWCEASSNEQGKERDGILRISYTNLPPGEYSLKVMASDNGSQWDGAVTELKITIQTPWWKTPIAYILYLSVLLIILIAGIRLYVYRTRKKLERQHKEEILLLRIRNLIDQCNQYESEQKTRSIPQKESPDTAFLTRAMEQVEKNINIPSYSVEQLSKDLCMDRTGLYRKLITLLDQSPSLFIRNIRLRKAAQLILETNLSIAEIADKVGFSSSSYLSKCFQEMYGCRPSEYAVKQEEST